MNAASWGTFAVLLIVGCIIGVRIFLKREPVPLDKLSPMDERKAYMQACAHFEQYGGKVVLKMAPKDQRTAERAAIINAVRERCMRRCLNEHDTLFAVHTALAEFGGGTSGGVAILRGWHAADDMSVLRRADAARACA